VNCAIVLGVALALPACDTGDSGPGLQPTIVTPPAKTETFTGTVAVGSSDVHVFTAANGGEVDITLIAAGPPATIVMGVGFGAPSILTLGACSLYSNGVINTAAGTTAQLTGTAPAGSYCVAVFDVGNQAAPINYSLTVVHPQ
jgi:hypothetical protein